jgi:hypothetical protein
VAPIELIGDLSQRFYPEQQIDGGKAEPLLANRRRDAAMAVPTRMAAQVNPNGTLVKDGTMTPDGCFDGVLGEWAASRATIIKTAQLVPPLALPTIGDCLDKKYITWGWFSCGWNDAVAGHPDLFQFKLPSIRLLRQVWQSNIRRGYAPARRAGSSVGIERQRLSGGRV